MRPTFIISAESKLADIRALLDSYAIELWHDGLVLFRGPLHLCEMSGDGHGITWDTPLTVDSSLDLRLIQYEPPTEDDSLGGVRERNTRWPFYVDAPLVICLSLGSQWWQYTFKPGKRYDVRSITL